MSFEQHIINTVERIREYLFELSQISVWTDYERFIRMIGGAVPLIIIKGISVGPSSPYDGQKGTPNLIHPPDI